MSKPVYYTKKFVGEDVVKTTLELVPYIGDSGFLDWDLGSKALSSFLTDCTMWVIVDGQKLLIAYQGDVALRELEAIQANFEHYLADLCRLSTQLKVLGLGGSSGESIQ